MERTDDVMTDIPRDAKCSQCGKPLGNVGDADEQMNPERAVIELTCSNPTCPERAKRVRFGVLPTREGEPKVWVRMK